MSVVLALFVSYSAGYFIYFSFRFDTRTSSPFLFVSFCFACHSLVYRSPRFEKFFFFPGKLFADHFVPVAGKFSEEPHIKIHIWKVLY